MNLPGLGQHCSLAGCGQLDFLPFECARCHGVFCLAHHKLEDHPCTYDRAAQNLLPQCPICQQFVYVKADASQDAIVDDHIASGCQLHLLTTHQRAQEGNLALATKCAQPTGCQNEEKLSTLICAKCNRQFCLAHRLPITHRCVALTAAAKAAADASAASADKHAKGNALLASIKAKREAKQAAQAQHDAAHAAAFPVGSTAAAASAARPTPNKPAGFVTLQQIRAGINAGAAATMAAITSVLPGGTPTPPPPVASASPRPTPSPSGGSGSSAGGASSSSGGSGFPSSLTSVDRDRAVGDAAIPASMRVYLRVDVRALKPKREPVLCFFSAKHTIGKVLDVICEAAAIENENHLPHGKRLFVCAPRIGATFPTDITLQMLEGQIEPGETITLERQPITPPA